MRTAQKLLLLGNRPVTWSSYAQSLAPVGWWSMRATSGTNEANRGSGGSALDMTITSATLGQTGKLGTNEAALMDGANSRYQTPNNAALAALTTFEYVFLVNPSSAGEGSAGRLLTWGQASFEPLLGFNGALTSLAARVSTAVASFDTITTTGLSASTWALVFWAYDNAGDRKSHIYKGVAGAVSEFGYSAQPAMTGTYKTPTNPLNLFNRTDQGLTFAGLGDEVLIFNGNLTSGQRAALCLAAGV